MKKNLKYIATTIILGALGSAFWEMCLKNMISLIVNKLAPYIMQYFNDSFYSRVSRSLNSISYHSYTYILFIVMVIVLFPPGYISKIFYSHQDEYFGNILQSIFLFACFFILAYNFLIVTIASDTARNTITNIEIVAPYITDVKYKQLRSDFFQVDSKSDYESLVEDITAIAEENNLQLK